MWLFSMPVDYKEMVEKISKCVFMISIICLFIFTSANENFASFMKSLSFNAEYEIAGIKFLTSM